MPAINIQVSIDDAWTPKPEVYSEVALPLEFKAHVDKWKRATLHSSSLTKMITHPSYLRIMGMGPAVLPLLLKELKERPDHWIVALNAITGKDPAPPGSTFEEAVDAWVRWGQTGGYLSKIKCGFVS